MSQIIIYDQTYFILIFPYVFFIFFHLMTEESHLSLLSLPKTILTSILISLINHKCSIEHSQFTHTYFLFNKVYSNQKLILICFSLYYLSCLTIHIIKAEMKKKNVTSGICSNFYNSPNKFEKHSLLLSLI